MIIFAKFGLNLSFNKLVGSFADCGIFAGFLADLTFGVIDFIFIEWLIGGRFVIGEN
jgi:hypothetical protein